MAYWLEERNDYKPKMQKMKTIKQLQYSFLLLGFMFIQTACDKNSSDLSVSNSINGKNGSLTRFLVKDHYMYAIDFNLLKVFDISNNDNPILKGALKVGFGIETIFDYGSYLYMGASDGMYIIDITLPETPSLVKKVTHQISCDPIVVQNNIAYSTQRMGAACGSGNSRSALVVYDVSNPTEAYELNAISLSEPYGLAVEESWLFVCDAGKGGIIVYDTTNKKEPEEKGIIMIPDPRDIILNYPYMIVSTKTDYQLFNYSQPLQTHYLSTFSLY